MFNNLIESSSHTNELKRRGSFFLFTVVTYAVLFVVAGVVSIYAYDASMDNPNTESVVMLSPMDFDRPSPPVQHRAPASGNNNGGNVAVREIAMASVNRPELAPKTTSAAPNTNPPVPDRGPFKIGPNSDPGGPIGPGNRPGGGGSETVGRGTPIVEVETPPPAPVEKPKPKILYKPILNGVAISLPKPPYPPIARQMRVQGTVLVQVLIDESGKVVSAKPVSGNPALLNAAQRAAFEARFSPTLLNDQPVKVSGVITYNFVLQ
ncbi:MAG TPA: energy transducer TonB [Pyrinomonadaceae bacterium]|nr:energy transducer TonB [Pyrinomonadaceae bacterium]